MSAPSAANRAPFSRDLEGIPPEAYDVQRWGSGVAQDEPDARTPVLEVASGFESLFRRDLGTRLILLALDGFHARL